MKQSETQTAVNCSKKLKSTRNSAETKDDSAATYFNRHIRQTFTERNRKFPKWADLALSNMLDSDVPSKKPLENTLPTGPKVQISYTQGERRGFSLSDRYNVRPFSGKYSAVTHKRTKLKEMLTHERCFANKT